MMSPQLNKPESHSDSVCDDDSTTSTSFVPVATAKRDEVKEVRSMSKRETQMIHVWRAVATLVLLAVALAVTVTSYHFLKDNQNQRYQMAYDQFSLTVAAAARHQQSFVRQALRGLSDSIEAGANAANATWPFYTLPSFENYAHHRMVQGNLEVMEIFHFVKDQQMEAWINYTDTHYQAWVKEGHMLQKGNLSRLVNTNNYHPYMTKPTTDGHMVPLNVTRDFYVPCWSYSPPPSSYGQINWDFRTVDSYEQITQAAIALKDETVMTPVKPYSVSIGLAFTAEEHNAMHSKLLNSNSSHPHCFVIHPIHKILQDPESDMVGFTLAGLALDASLQNLLPEGVSIMTVIKNNCNQTYTYKILGPEALFMGEGDHHDPQFDDMEVSVSLYEGLFTNPNFTTTAGHCLYTMHIYPSEEFKDSHIQNTPEVFAGVVAFTFVLVAAVFVVYDLCVQHRNNKIITAAARSNAVVSSLFPGNMRDRVMATEAGTTNRRGGRKSRMNKGYASLHKLGCPGSKPLADLFLDCTILFADITGFTSWSSVREPHQVFTLLETVYGAFDIIAQRRMVFKVETVGDCYVAASGLPDPRKDHAVAMARFAWDILQKMTNLTKELVVTLGPDTGDLSLRIGMHSGPVTAGVLRGERARFQLFGDTVNTAGRIESSSWPGNIQISMATAGLLQSAGKGFWLEKRPDLVVLKGKGEVETYWLNVHRVRDEGSSVGSSSHTGLLATSSVDFGTGTRSLGNLPLCFDEGTSRLIEWNTVVLTRLLKAVVAQQKSTTGAATRHIKTDIFPKTNDFVAEVVEIIHLPDFDHKAVRRHKNPDEIELPQQVMDQLRHYVASIASMYRDNPFHNFEHASHVMMSVNKLMSRIIARADLDLSSDMSVEDVDWEPSPKLSRKQRTEMAASLHDHTYGITSNPLTLFACAFSALIHDVDHTGVPNVQLIKENAAIAGQYNNRSVAEQNSLELAWSLLMDDCYCDFRAAIYTTEAELKRFRELLVNGVMATDIADKDLKALRNNRWDKAFQVGTINSDGDRESKPVLQTVSERDAINRKATIVIEHLIQASDVSHTMQHWHVYRKWNECLFAEVYKAYKAGRADVDPSEFWYKGEIGFFDFYLIPLSKKLKECGVFGKSSDEFLNYAVENRREWVARGQEVVANMVEKLNAMEAQEPCNGNGQVREIWV